jgi:uncharacterized protein (TIGR00255 family)
MIRSMTGFGRGEARLSRGKITVEIKTVNHKFFDETLKLPENMASFEDRIKELLQKGIKRGKVNLNLAYDGEPAKGESIVINTRLARNYRDELSRLEKELKIKDHVSVKEIIMLPGVLKYEAAGSDFYKAVWPKIKEALDKAIAKLIDSREKEGRSTYLDLKARAKKIGGLLAAIKARAHLHIHEYRKAFADRIKDLSSGLEIDKGRLEMEVAIFAKNSDISEEITRLENHLTNFNNTIAGNGEVGKKLDFIAQELQREANTIGSKASDFKIAKAVIEIKGEIEKIREQAKNLE